MIGKVISECIKNDKKAQHRLYHLLKSKIMGVCHRYMKNLPEAEDAFQESMIKIFDKLSTLTQAEAVYSWSKRIAVNTCLNILNTKHHNIQMESFEDNNGLSYDPEVLSSYSTKELLAFINELSTSYRIVFNLFVIDGYSHKEIGEMLNISENTSKSHLKDAKRILAERLTSKEKKYEKYA